MNDTNYQLKIAVCEDDEQEYARLLGIISESGIPAICEYFANGESFMAGFFTGRYDLIFLDIYMDGMTGVETAAALRAADSGVIVAFVTTSRDHALEGYRFHVNRYILKPFSKDEIIEVMTLARNLVNSMPGITVRSSDGDITVPAARIRYVEQSGHSLVFYLTGGRTVRSGGKLDDIEKQLAGGSFLRSHKSYLVNLAHVLSVDKELCIFRMNGGGNAHIRRSTLKAASMAFEKYMFEETRNRK